MTHQFLSRPAIRTALASLTSVVVLALVSTQAQAGCGRYAHTSPPHGVAPDVHATRLFQLEALLHAMPAEPAPPLRGGGTPCSGPGCSNRSMPSEAPVTHRVELEQDWCLGTASTDLAQGEPAHAPPPESTTLPILITGSIERPPRG